MTKQEIIKKANSFRGANREFSQEMGPIVEGILDMVEDNTEAIETKQDAPEEAGTAGQILKLDANGDPVWANPAAGSTMDDDMSDESENPVQNKVIKGYVDTVAATKEDNSNKVTSMSGESTDTQYPSAKSVWTFVSNAISTVKEWASGIFARMDGWYSTLVAGAAENLVGRGSVPAEFTFRTSGGNQDLGTGTATIDVMKGKTLKWQQQQVKPLNTTSTYFYTNGGSVTYSNGVISYLASNATNNINTYPKRVSIPSGHKVYISIVVKATTDNTEIKFAGSSINQYTEKQSIKTSWTKISRLFTSSGEVLLVFSDARESDWDTIYIKDEMMIIDLTEMGLDSITSPAEFEALYPLDYYDYTATPVLINNAAKGIVTTGFNQWDEETIVGYLDDNGGYHPSANSYCSKNFCRCFPNTSYFFKATIYTYGPVLRWYNASFEVVGITTVSQVNTVVQSPITAVYFKISAYEGGSYNNDICINISWSGYRNGEYEPYEKHTLYFNGESGSLATLKGQKLVNGEPDGNSVYIFDQTGMKSAGSVYDFGKADSDGYIRKVTKVLKKLVLNADNTDQIYTFAQYNGNYYVAYKPDFTPDAKPGSYNIISTNGKGANSATPDSMYIIGSSTNLAWFPLDQTITTKEAYETYISNNPVTLYYELNTPEEYLLDTPIPANYLVNDFGTEQRIPVDTASSVMANISYTVQYSMNAVDELRRLGTNFIRKSSMDNILTALVTAGIIGSYTLTYNGTDDDYDCTIEAPTPGE